MLKPKTNCFLFQTLSKQVTLSENVQKVIELSHRIIVEKSVIQSCDENSTKTTEISMENTKRVVLSDNNGTSTESHHQHHSMTTISSSHKEITQQTTRATSNGDIVSKEPTSSPHSETVINGSSECHTEVINGSADPASPTSPKDTEIDKARADVEDEPDEVVASPTSTTAKERIVDLPKLIKPQAASEFTIPYNIVNNYFSVGVVSRGKSERASLMRRRTFAKIDYAREKRAEVGQANRTVRKGEGGGY